MRRLVVLLTMVMLPSTVWAECREYRYSEMDSMSLEDIKREAEYVIQEAKYHLDTALDYKQQGQMGEYARENALAKVCINQASILQGQMYLKLKRR